MAAILMLNLMLTVFIYLFTFYLEFIFSISKKKILIIKPL